MTETLFVSYTSADGAWAEWVVSQLMAAGFDVNLRRWDFRPGTDFRLEVQAAAARQGRTLAILSPAFFAFRFGTPEWVAALRADPGASGRRLIAVRASPCEVPGHPQPIAAVDLFDESEPRARRALLRALGRASGGAGQPLRPARFPCTPALPAAGLAARNPDFVGRDALLEALHTRLAHGARTALLVGRAGSGKAQLALEYAYRYAADHAGVFWLSAGRPELLRLSSRPLAAALGRAELAGPGGSLGALGQALERAPAWLIVLEAARDAAALQQLLPRSGAVRCLVIAAEPELELPEAERFEVSVLQPAHARELLELRTGVSDAASHERLAERLGQLPFALEQAARYMRATGASASAYLESFERMLRALRAHPERLGFETAVVTSYSLNQAALATPALRALLQLLAQLAPEPLALADLLAGEAYLDPPLRAACAVLQAGEAPATDSDRELVSSLRESALLTFDPAARSVRLHPLAQSVLRRALPDEDLPAALDRAAGVLCEALLALGRAPDRQEARAQGLVRLLPHACALAERAAVREHDSAALRALTYAVGRALSAQGELALAESWLRGGVARARAGQPDLPLVAAALAELASVLGRDGRAQSAVPLLQEALALVPADADPVRHASLANNLGQLLLELERSPEAGVLLAQALPCDPDSPELLAGLARARKAEGRMAEAETLYRRALDRTLQQAPLDQALCASVLNNLASLLHAQGKLVEAQGLYRRALAASEELLGPDHPQLGVLLNNLASLCQDLGEPREAEALYRRALRSVELQPGVEHPIHGTALANLASVLHDAGQLTAAEALYRRALESAQRSLGPEHTTTAIRLSNLGAVLQAQDRLDEAEPLLVDALRVAERVRGASHFELAAHLNNLGALLERRGRLQEAAALLERARAIVDAAPGHLQRSAVRENLAALRARSLI